MPTDVVADRRKTMGARQSDAAMDALVDALHHTEPGRPAHGVERQDADLGPASQATPTHGADPQQNVLAA